MRGAAQRLAVSAHFVGKNFGNENPDDRALPDSVRSDEHKQPQRHHDAAERFGKKRESHSRQGNNVADAADVHQKTAPLLVNQRQTHHGKNEVHQADACGREQGCVVAHAGHVENARSVVDHCVDARYLVEKSDQKSEQDREFEFAGNEGAPVGSAAGFFDVDGRNRFVGGGRICNSQDAPGFFYLSFIGDEPAGAFRHKEDHNGVQNGRKNFDAQHPAPAVAFAAADEVIGEISHQNAQHQIELEHGREPTAFCCWRNFGNVHRRSNGRSANAQSTDEPEKHEPPDVWRKGRTRSRNQVQDGNPEQRFFAPDAIRWNATKQGADHRAVQRHGNHLPQH